MKEAGHLALHPFGKIPTYEEGDLVLFETGAIVLHLAELHTGLLPKDPDARARAITWMFAALNTVEPAIVELATARLLEGDKPWSKERQVADSAGSAGVVPTLPPQSASQPWLSVEPCRPLRIMTAAVC